MPEAIPVFDAPRALTIVDDESDPNEQRFVTVGIGALGRLLVVVYTWQGETIRILSARPGLGQAPTSTRRVDLWPTGFQNALGRWCQSPFRT